MPDRETKKKIGCQRVEHRLSWPESIYTRHSGAVTSMDRLYPQAQSLVSFLLG